jgi:hypothetical protein
MARVMQEYDTQLYRFVRTGTDFSTISSGANLKSARRKLSKIMEKASKIEVNSFGYSSPRNS